MATREELFQDRTFPDAYEHLSERVEATLGTLSEESGHASHVSNFAVGMVMEILHRKEIISTEEADEMLTECALRFASKHQVDAKALQQELNPKTK